MRPESKLYLNWIVQFFHPLRKSVFKSEKSWEVTLCLWEEYVVPSTKNRWPKCLTKIVFFLLSTVTVLKYLKLLVNCSNSVNVLIRWFSLCNIKKQVLGCYICWFLPQKQPNDYSHTKLSWSNRIISLVIWPSSQSQMSQFSKKCPKYRNNYCSIILGFSAFLYGISN